MKRIGALVIGDEILGGHVHESNSHWLAQQVKPLGVSLRRVEVCTDEVPDIEESIRRFVERGFEFLVTSGGLGPTPDDRTMEGLARALGVPLEATKENEAWMAQRTKRGHELGYFQSPIPNAGLRKMILLPQGATAMPNDLGTALGAIVQAGPRPTTLFTLPGVPSEFKRMFEQSVRPYLGDASAIHTEDLVLYTEESRLYETLLGLEREFPDVVLGSYPERGQIRIRATSPDAARARMLIERLRHEASAYVLPAGRFAGR